MTTRSRRWSSISLTSVGDRLRPVIAWRVAGGQGVCLVDEQHPAQGAGHRVGRPAARSGRCRNQPVQRGRPPPGARKSAGRAGHRSAAISRATVVLAVPGWPVKIMCRDGRPQRHARVAAQRLGPGLGGQEPDLLLDRLQPDHRVQPRDRVTGLAGRGLSRRAGRGCRRRSAPPVLPASSTGCRSAGGPARLRPGPAACWPAARCPWLACPGPVISCAAFAAASAVSVNPACRAR